MISRASGGRESGRVLPVSITKEQILPLMHSSPSEDRSVQIERESVRDTYGQGSCGLKGHPVLDPNALSTVQA